MKTTTECDPSVQAADISVVGMTLRVSSQQQPSQDVTLAGGKLSIGSSPGSSLRLVQPGVQSLHCLIVRGRTQTVVRAFAPRTRLNGEEFTDATLKCGDHLQVGSVGLEVLSGATTETAKAASASWPNIWAA